METTTMGTYRVQGLEDMKKRMEITITGYLGTTTRIHSFVPNQPKVNRSTSRARRFQVSDATLNLTGGQ